MNGNGHMEEEVDLDLCDPMELSGDRHIVETRECRIKLCEGMTLFFIFFLLKINFKIFILSSS